MALRQGGTPLTQRNTSHLYPSTLDKLHIATVDEFKTVYRKILAKIANMQNTIDAQLELMASPVTHFTPSDTVTVEKDGTYHEKMCGGPPEFI